MLTPAKRASTLLLLSSAVSDADISCREFFQRYYEWCVCATLADVALKTALNSLIQTNFRQLT